MQPEGRVSERDLTMMGRALALAASVARTSPNPKVGALLERHGTVIAEAAHQGAGHPHAEMAALEGIDASGATLYINLEPCSHRTAFDGSDRTPCCEAVVAAGIRRVVAAMEDPDPRVHGRGFEYLRSHGIDVEVGLLEDEARRINAAFVQHRTTGRPLVTLKLALTLDGRLAAPDGTARWITGPEARTQVHERRATADAVMVGAGTIAADNPQLTARDVDAARQPLRVLVDSSGRTEPDAKIFDGPGEALVATTDAAPHEAHTSWKEAGADVIVLPAGRRGVDLAELLNVLGARRLLDLYCEGGAELATSLLAADLVDRLELHYAPKLAGIGGPDIGDLGVRSMSDAKGWSITETTRRGRDLLVTLERGES
jgi:diaminohydroxyphosphoribosylaminopyrimidine deaminase / 5-amino-6-(5-phosphoribosylamino)uracil reductase